MEIEIGKRYTDAWGRRYKIEGYTSRNPDWVYSLCGWWFEKATGKLVVYSAETGHYVGQSSNRDLVREAEDVDTSSTSIITGHRKRRTVSSKS